MDPKEKERLDEKQSAGQESGCFRDPEDALLDLSKMTPEEVKDYLNELFRNRFFGC